MDTDERSTIGELLARIKVLESELRRQNDQLQALQRTDEQSSALITRDGTWRLSRAGMLKAATAGAAATVGAGVFMQARTPLAAATTGNPIIAGQLTTGEGPTSLYYDSTTTTGVMFVVSDFGPSGSLATYPAALGGWAGGNAGMPNGVYGYTLVAGGSGVVGWNHATSTTVASTGVYGRIDTNEQDSAAVKGEVTNAAPGFHTSGVYGLCSTTDPSATGGHGVWGLHLGAGSAVLGNSTYGTGVLGVTGGAAQAAVGGIVLGPGVYAIYGSSEGISTAYAGVFNGNVSVTGGSTTVHNPSGHAILGTSDATHYGGLSGATTVSGGAGLIGTNSNVAGAYGGLIYGPLVVTGTKSAAVMHPDGTRRLVYCVEAPESYLEDVGEASLTNGKATVHLREDFAALIDTRHYYVFLTPLGSPDASLAVAERHGKHFVVAGLRHDAAFQYRIMAKRGDIKAERLARFDVPEPDIVAAMHHPEIPQVPAVSNHARP